MPRVTLKIAPPSNAYYVLALVLAPRDREAIVGDMIEEYRDYLLPEFGARRAKIWFWMKGLPFLVHWEGSPEGPMNLRRRGADV